MISSGIDTAALAGKKIREIEQRVFADYTQRPSISLMNGNGGLLLLYYSLYRHFQDDGYRTRAEMITDHLLDLVNEKITSSTYCDGLTGLAFLFNYLSEKGFFGPSIASFLVKCDEMLLSVFSKVLDKENIDYLHGALGMAVYFMDRYEGDGITVDAMRQIGRLVADRLEDGIHSGVGDNQYMSGQNDDEGRYFNCGMAHGLVSSLMFLSKYYTRVDRSDRIKNILQAAATRLLQFKSADPHSLAYFPSIVKISNGTAQSTYDIPLGWCYGDTTISIGLYNAGMALKDQSLIDEATTLALESTKRDTKQTSLVYDACFCHGSAGVAHIYKKWYQFTRHPDFKASYQFWIQKTLDLCSFEDGIGGYKKCTGDSWSNEYGILDGACGPALVLTDFLSNCNDTDWDRFFLLS